MHAHTAVKDGDVDSMKSLDRTPRADARLSSSAPSTSFADLPVEVLAHAASAIDRGRDVLAWHLATGAPIDGALGDLVVARIRRDGATSLFGTGIPLPMLLSGVKRSAASIEIAWVRAATRASRVDIIEWLCTTASDALANSPNVDPVADAPRRCGRPDHHHAAGHPHAPKLDRACEALYGALKEPIDTPRVFRHLVAQMRRFGLAVDPSAVWEMFEGAMKCRRTAVALDAHDFMMVAHGGRCRCPYYYSDCPHMGLGGDLVAIRHLNEVGCKGVETFDRTSIEKAIAAGEVSRARALIAVLPVATVDKRAVVEAAEAGRVGAVAFAHVSKLCPCDGDVLAAAAAKGKINVLKWAAGECNTQHDADRPPGDPVAAWRTSAAAHGAVYGNQRDVLAWLLQRPDAETTVTVGVARMAVTCGRSALIEAIHAAHPARFDGWRPLDAALAHHDFVPVVQTLSDYGARPNSSTFVQALVHGRHNALAHLCACFGTEGLQEAVDAVVGLGLRSTSALVWVRDNVRSVCVAEARAAAIVSLGDYARARLNNLAGASCRCDRCAAS